MSVTIELMGQEISNDGGLRRYHVYEVSDAATAYQLVRSLADAVWNGLYAQPPKMKELGDQVWEGTVRYAVLPSSDPDQNPGATPDWSFEITTQTIHVTQAKDHVATYVAAGLDADDFKHFGAINVRPTSGGGKEAQGCDALFATFSWEETYYVPYLTVINPTYVALLESLVGTVNEDAFRFFAAGELFLRGVRGARRGERAVGLTFGFNVSRNKTALSFPATNPKITGVAKKGFEYLWFEFWEEADGTLTNRIKACHVERIYDNGDWDQLGLPDPWNP